MGDDGHGASLAEVQVLIREADAERARLVRDGHPRGDQANPACPLGCIEMWLTALWCHHDRLLRRSPPPSGGRRH